MKAARTEPHVGNGTAAPYVRVIGKAVAALDAFLDGNAELTSTELARRLGMSRSTVHRLLATMERHRLVDRTETGAYGLGIHLFRLGSAVPVRAVLGRLSAQRVAPDQVLAGRRRTDRDAVPAGWRPGLARESVREV